MLLRISLFGDLTKDPCHFLKNIVFSVKMSLIIVINLELSDAL